MAKKAHFTPAQQEIIRATAKKIWRTKFEWMKKVRGTKEHPGHPGGQEAMALALGVTQQTVSSLIDPKGSYHPGYRVATAIANLDGKTLETLVGDYGDDDEEIDDEMNGIPPRPTPATLPPPPMSSSVFTNLDKCLAFYENEKTWSPWTIACARAGFFGNADFAPPAWAGKLDQLEKVLDRARKP